MEKINYSFHSQFVYRTPIFPITTESKDLRGISLEPTFMEAIYLASPTLHEELTKWHEGKLRSEKDIQKLTSSLSKYLSRMQARCTPYGLFAGCSTGEWSDVSSTTLSQEIDRHTRLDMNFLCALSQRLSTHPVIKPLLKFYPNNSLYFLGDKLRYVEYKYSNNLRTHQISSVDFNEYLEKVLSHAEIGLRPKALASVLVTMGIQSQEADEFIQTLIDSQLLISELEPAVTGDEFIFQLIRTLNNVQSISTNPDVDEIISILQDVHQSISQLDNSVGNSAEKYRMILKRLNFFNVTFEENMLFQVDLYKPSNQVNLSLNIQDDLLKIFNFFNQLTPKDYHSNLRRFKDNFILSYEDAEIPLLEALDTESGIGYTGIDNAGVNPLIDDLIISAAPKDSSELSWNSLQKTLHDKLMIAIKKEDYTVIFHNSDIETINYTSSLLPDSISAMFRIIDETGKLYVQSFAGSSAANLLGRFAHGNGEIQTIIKDITNHEQRNNNDKLLAEIVHLPESRTGNILLRPILRNYEIPYIGKSAMSVEHQMPLQDLMISIRNNKIFLRSKKYDKEVIPRLSTAHNYSFNSLPAYHFLCDLQTQEFEKQSLYFNWGGLSNNYKFLPRVEYENIVVFRATWQLTKLDYRELLDSSIRDLKIVISNWRQKWRIPQHVVLADGDNELFINFDITYSATMFIDIIKKRAQIVLHEFLFDLEKPLIKNSDGSGFVNEFIAILLRNKDSSTLQLQDITSIKNVKNNSKDPERNFSLGSEWVYYKIYCGIKTSDNLLISAINRIVDTLLSSKLITKFFFIRYSDPQPHIRLRLLLTNSSALSPLIICVHNYFSPYQKQRLIRNIILDTYNRELERYGANTIEISESIFHIYSIATIRLLVLSPNESDEDLRWHFALRSLDALLKIFRYEGSEKFELLDKLRLGYAQEHGGGKHLKVQLDSKYRQLRETLEEIFGSAWGTTNNSKPISDLLSWMDDQLVPLASEVLKLKENGELMVQLDSLVSSYSHMMFNRIFRSRQRTFEMLCYDLLYKHYKSVEGRKKSKVAH